MVKKVTYTTPEELIDSLPAVNDPTGVYLCLSQKSIDTQLISALDQLINITDVLLSKWLSITPRTYRNYKNNKTLVLKSNLKEHIILIMSLYKHGKLTFGSVASFESWLSLANPLLENRSPQSFLDTISGIQFIDDRLTAIDYGENA